MTESNLLQQFAEIDPFQQQPPCYVRNPFRGKPESVWLRLAGRYIPDSYTQAIEHPASEPHTLQVGDIITNSWGYDQTNVDWYRIVKTTRHYVWLQPICAEIEENGFMSGSTVPAVDTSSADPTSWGFRDAKGKVEKHKASGNNVCMEFGSGSKWDGKTRYCSWYA